MICIPARPGADPLECIIHVLGKSGALQEVEQTAPKPEADQLEQAELHTSPPKPGVHAELPVRSPTHIIDRHLDLPEIRQVPTEGPVIESILLEQGVGVHPSGALELRENLDELLGLVEQSSFGTHGDSGRTGQEGGCWVRTAIRFSVASSAMRRRAPRVALPR